MHLFNHHLSHYFSNVVHHIHLHHPILYHTSPLDAWPSELRDKPDRIVDKVESCCAHTMTPGHEGCPPVIDKEHYHTFLRVTLAPSKAHPEEIIFIERVLTRRDGATHSVIPVATDGMAVSSAGGGKVTFHDHACVILEGSPSALIHAHHLKADHDTHFLCCRERLLSLYELATLLRFVSAYGLHDVTASTETECEAYSRWFCRATMGALLVVTQGAFWHLTPPKGGMADPVEIVIKKSVDAWLASTFKTYPVRAVAAENLVRLYSLSHASQLTDVSCRRGSGL